jgi:hypothetical protein
MNGFNKCDNGHFYKEDLTACPYCPGGKGAASNPTSVDLNKTVVPGGNLGGGDTVKTEIFGTQGGSSSPDKTEVFGSGNATGASKPNRDLNRTYIAGVTDIEPGSSGANGVADSAPRSTRRIVGWIISYSLDPMGVDYRIYEGSNTIGRDAGNTITITKDSTISGKHVNILYRQGKFWIKDEMTANGTYLNDLDLGVEKPHPLNDGDSIRIGSTTFKFKCSE